MPVALGECHLQRIVVRGGFRLELIYVERKVRRQGAKRCRKTLDRRARTFLRATGVGIVGCSTKGVNRSDLSLIGLIDIAKSEEFSSSGADVTDLQHRVAE